MNNMRKNLEALRDPDLQVLTRAEIERLLNEEPVAVLDAGSSPEVSTREEAYDKFKKRFEINSDVKCYDTSGELSEGVIIDMDDQNKSVQILPEDFDERHSTKDLAWLPFENVI